MFQITTGILVFLSTVSGVGGQNVEAKELATSTEIVIPHAPASISKSSSKKGVSAKDLSAAIILASSSDFTDSNKDKEKQKQIEQAREEERLEQLKSPKIVEQYVREYFKDIPILIYVAKCESRFRQIGEDNEVVRGEHNNQDVGVMQINEQYHLERATKLGYDIYSIEGNMAYARRLYDQQGTVPWSSSGACWEKYKNREVATN